VIHPSLLTAAVPLDMVTPMPTRALGTLLLAAALVAACSASSNGGSGTLPPVDSGPATMSDAADTDTWSNWAAGFFTTYCIECHSASDPKGLDFGEHSIVTTNRAQIRCGVCVAQEPAWGCPAVPAAKQFPISDSAGTNPKPSDADRDRVVAWINAGCP
jgi:hypothetical protein